MNRNGHSCNNRKRWIVERTFAWIGRDRRTAKDYERNTESSKAIIYIAMTARMLKLLKKRKRQLKTRANGTRGCIRSNPGQWRTALMYKDAHFLTMQRYDTSHWLTVRRLSPKHPIQYIDFIFVHPFQRRMCRHLIRLRTKNVSETILLLQIGNLLFRLEIQ